MPKNETLFKNNTAVSEVVAQMLMTTMVLISLSGIGAVVLSFGEAENPPQPELQEWASVFSDTISLRHCGGEPIEVSKLKIKLDVNGVPYLYPSEKIYQNLGKSRWEMGEEIQLNTKTEWGLNLKRDDAIKLYLIDTPSNQLIQKFTVSAFGPPEWITPQGGVQDTSGGFAKLSDVQAENDEKVTVYYPPQNSDPNIYQEFVFEIDTEAYGLRPGDRISNVLLKLAYQGHDNNYESIKLSYWDENSKNMEEYEQNLPELNDYNSTTVDLSTYIDSAEELKNLKIRFYAVKNAASGKEINLDYVAIKIS
ncbi:MAG: type IV pilin N-terminal domain-containing protein [Methanosarcinaceae archaeon]|nr:type IV pilin N-terminal domain-containing protein [Methanosarcinaceae archaeon]MDD4331276.1 type IV pilin N-terminal domain-containing protein [Methanosarcinaceae archaeon]MDD4748530.1 type IV pilin N-terminal domain-containing protein [Methanosarcinaceae archaeon]